MTEGAVESLLSAFRAWLEARDRSPHSIAAYLCKAAGRIAGSPDCETAMCKILDLQPFPATI